jgi:hypothetical protein
MKHRKLLSSSLLVLPILLGGAITTFAEQRTQYYSYDVPKINGHSSTGVLRKLSRTSAVNNNISNESGETLKSWVVSSAHDTPVTSTVTFGSGQRVNMPYKGNNIKQYVGRNYRMSIGTGWLDFSDIHTKGFWSPDDK